MPRTAEKQPDVREYLAAERTLLAYIRTGLALMGFGFLIARFSLFLPELPLVSPGVPRNTPGLSLWFGTAFVLLGIALNCLSALEYRKLIKRLNSAQAANWPVAKIPVATAFCVAGCGALMTAYLVWLR